MFQHRCLAYLICVVSFGQAGCDNHQLDLANTEQRYQAEQAVARQALDVVVAETKSLESQLHRAEQRAVAAEDELAMTQSQLQRARKQSTELKHTTDRTNKILADAEGRIDRALAALNEKTNDRTVSTADPDSASKFAPAKFLSWNVESDGSDPQVIAKQLAELKGYDVFALSEVLPAAFSIYASAVGDSFGSVQSKTGHSDRLQILYDQQRFELVRKMELDEINFELRYRSPLVVHLREKDSGIEFLLMVNHLARGKADIRTKQAQQLVGWARDQNLPIIALGDYNFDYDFASKNGNEGFRAMLTDNIWKWVEPLELIDTNWFDNPEHPDGLDDYPGSLLDFAFVAGSAKTWNVVCNVLVRPNDFPDDATTSDHRAFELIVNP